MWKVFSQAKAPLQKSRMEYNVLYTVIVDHLLDTSKTQYANMLCILISHNLWYICMYFTIFLIMTLLEIV